MKLRELILAALLSACMVALSAGCSTSQKGNGRIPGDSTPASQTGNPHSDEVPATELEKAGVPLERDDLGRVRWIEAAKGELTDEAMRHIADLHALEWLEIGAGVTAAGVAHLEGLPGIRRLYIHDVDLVDDDLGWLAGLSHLEALSLQRTGISGRALGNLKATDTLMVLNLSDNDIRDEDLGQIAPFKRLEVLALENTKVTGAGLARLTGMPRLNVLNLNKCRILDSDLEHLASMANLRIVYAAGCHISESAVKELHGKARLLSIFQ